MRKKLLIILIGLLIISPELVKAETKEPPIIKWENVDIKPGGYRGTTLLCDAGDGYIAIDNNNEIAKYNYDGKKEKTIISNFNHYISAAFVDDNSLIIAESNGNTIYKYSLEGELITSNKIDTESSPFFKEIVIGKDGYYIGNTNNPRKIIKFDKNLNRINEYKLDTDTYSSTFAYLVNENNEIIVIQNKEDYQTKLITKLDSDLNFISQEEKPGLDLEYQKIKETSDGYIAIAQANYSSVIIKLDKDFNEEKISGFDNIDVQFTDIEVVSDGYIAIGYLDLHSANTPPIFAKYDLNGNIMYELNYRNDFLSSNNDNNYPFEKIIVLGDDDFIVYANVGYGSYNEYYGSIIIRYGYNEYKITTNIIGKGTLNPSVEKSVAGNNVTYTSTPDTGYILKNITVTTSSGKKIETKDNSFIMPDEDVIIEAEFVKEITTNPNTGNIIMIITGILIIAILGTVIALYYKKKFN